MAQEMIEVKPMVTSLVDAVARLRRMHLANLPVKDKDRVIKHGAAAKKKSKTIAVGSS